MANAIDPNKEIDWGSTLEEQSNTPTQDNQGIDWLSGLQYANQMDNYFGTPQQVSSDEGTSWGDYGTAYMQGSANVAQGVGGLIEYGGQALGLPEVESAGKTLRDVSTEAGKDWQRGMSIGTAKDNWQLGGYTPAAMEAMGKQWATLGEDAAWKDPTSIALATVQSLPFLATSMAPGVALTKLNAGVKAMMFATGAFNGAQIAGGVAANLANTIENMSDEELMQVRGAKEIMDSGASPEEVRRMIIADVSSYVVPGAFAIGAVSGMLGGPVETAIATKIAPKGASAASKGFLNRLIAKAAAGGRAKAITIGTTVEGGQEIYESTAAETMLPNYGLGKPIMQGTGEAAVSGLVVGSASGAGLGGVSPGSYLHGNAGPHPGTGSNAGQNVNPPPPKVTPDLPTPEPTSYIQRQLQLVDNGTRKAVYAAPGTDVGEIDPNRFDVVDLGNRGQLIVAAGDADTAAVVQDAVALGDNAAIQAVLANVLGYGSEGKRGTGQVLTVYDANHDVVYDAEFDGSQEMIDAANAAATSIGGSVDTRSSEEALQARDVAYYNEQNPQTEPTEQNVEQTPPPTEREQTQPTEPLSQPPVVQETTPTVQTPPEPTISSPLSLKPLPDDANPSARMVADAYTKAVNTTRNIPHGVQTETRAQAADDLLTTMLALYHDMQKEGYPMTGFHKIFWPVIGRTSLKNLLAGNFLLPSERSPKQLGGSSDLEVAERTVAAGTEMGPGRKSGTQSGKIVERTFEHMLANAKAWLDNANEQRQLNRAAPATPEDKEARTTKAIEAEAERQAAPKPEKGKSEQVKLIREKAKAKAKAKPEKGKNEQVKLIREKAKAKAESTPETEPAPEPTANMTELAKAQHEQSEAILSAMEEEQAKEQAYEERKAKERGAKKKAAPTTAKSVTPGTKTTAEGVEIKVRKHRKIVRPPESRINSPGTQLSHKMTVKQLIERARNSVGIRQLFDSFKIIGPDFLVDTETRIDAKPESRIEYYTEDGNQVIASSAQEVVDYLNYFLDPADPYLSLTRAISKKLDLTDIPVVWGKDTSFGSSDRGDAVGGHYDQERGIIRLNEIMAEWMQQGRLSPRVGVQTFVHELVHAATFHSVTADSEVAAEMDMLRKEAIRQLRVKEGMTTDMLKAQFYGLTNVHEFMAEAMSNFSFQNELSKLKSISGSTQQELNLPSLWDNFVQKVRKTLGLDPSTTSLLDDVLRLNERMITSNEGIAYDMAAWDYGDATTSSNFYWNEHILGPFHDIDLYEEEGDYGMDAAMDTSALTYEPVESNSLTREELDSRMADRNRRADIAIEINRARRSDVIKNLFGSTDVIGHEFGLDFSSLPTAKKIKEALMKFGDSNSVPTSAAHIVTILKQNLSPEDPYIHLIRAIEKRGLDLKQLPVQWSFGFNMAGNGAYGFNPDDVQSGEYQTIILNDGSGYLTATGKLLPNKMLRVFMHELTHAATVTAMTTDSETTKHLDNIRKDVIDFLMHTEGWTEDQTVDHYYGLTKVQEFVAEAFTNPRFQQLLARMDFSRLKKGRQMELDLRTGWDKFVDAVRTTLGIGFNTREGNVLNEVLTVSESLLQSQRAHEYALLNYESNKIFRENDPKTIPSKVILNSIDEQESYAIKNDPDGGVGSNILTSAISGNTQAQFDKAKAYARDGGNHGFEFLLGMLTNDTILREFGMNFENMQKVKNSDGTLSRENPLKNYFEARLAEQAEAKKFERHAELTHNKWAKVERAYSKGTRKQSQWDSFNNLITEATMYEVHPDKPWTSSDNAITRNNNRAKKAGEVAHKRLSRQFRQLPKDMRDLYIEVRDFYKNTSESMRTTAIDSIADMYELDNPTLRRLMKSAKTADDLMKINPPINNWDKIAGMIGKLNENIRANGPYFPLNRTGDYVLSFEHSETVSGFGSKEKAYAAAQNMRGEEPGSKTSPPYKGKKGWQFTITVPGFSLFESLSEAEAMRASLQADGAKVSQITRKLDFVAGDLPGLAGQIMAQVERKMSGPGSERSKMVLREALINMLPDTSIRKRFLRRKNIAGASKNHRQAFASYVQSAGWHMAKMKHRRGVDNAFAALIDAGKGKVDSNVSMRMSQVVNEVNKRHNAVLNRPGKLGRGVAKFGFINFLLSGSYSIINATQNYTMALPYLGGKFGTKNAIAALARAYGMVGGTIGKTIIESKGGLAAFNKEGEFDLNVATEQVIAAVAEHNSGAAEMLRTLADVGIIDATFALEVSEAARSGKRTLVDKVIEAGRVMPFAVEIMNRATTAVAAYEMSMANAKPGSIDEQHAAAVAAAREAVVMTQFDYTELNRPRFFTKSDILRAMTMFKIYPLGVYSFMAHNIRKAMGKNASIEQRREGAKTMALMMMTHGSLAGAAGSILMEPIRIILTLLASSFNLEDDDDWLSWMANPEVAMREMLYEVTGSPAMSEIITHGLPRAIGIDISTRVGLQNLLIQWTNYGDHPLRDSVVNSIMGPLLGSSDSFTRGIDYLNNGGDLLRASEYFMPKAVRDLTKTYRYASTGMTDWNGNVIQEPDEFSKFELASRAFGFGTSTESETYMGRSYIQGLKNRVLKQRKAFMNRYATAGNRAEQREVWREIQEWNKNLPKDMKRPYKLTRADLVRSLRARRKHMRDTEEGVHLTRDERQLRDRIEFLNLQ